MNDPGTGALLRRVIAAHMSAARGALLAAAACLAACASLPGSGPSARDIKGSGTGVIRVVDVDDSVVNRLLERRADKLFSEVFETHLRPVFEGRGDVRLLAVMNRVDEEINSLLSNLKRGGSHGADSIRDLRGKLLKLGILEEGIILQTLALPKSSRQPHRRARAYVVLAPIWHQSSGVVM